MSTVLGLIDIRNTILLYNDQEECFYLNVELANALKHLNSHYDVNFHLYSYDNYNSFSNHKDMGIPKFCDSYSEISGLSNEAILRNGIFDISKKEKTQIDVPKLAEIYEFFKESAESFEVIMEHYGAEKENTFLVDDAKANLKGAIEAGITAISSHEDNKDCIEQVTQFVMSHASPK